MDVLSLFDGMSGGQIALTNMGVKIDNYYASEIDKHAIAQTQLNFPNTKQLGGVTEWQTWNIDWSSINILFAGSPCQGFSFAGKQLAFDDPRSKLFFVFVDILNHIRKFNPDVLFLLENVKMKAEHEAVITRYCGINPIEINSALLSAQNRVRLYWTNIGVVKRGLFDEYYPGIPQPKDKGILLRDILKTDVPEKYYLSEKMLKVINQHGAIDTIENNKSNCLLTSYHKMGGRDQQYVKDFQGLDINKKSRTLRTGGGQSQDDKHNWDLIMVQGAIKFVRTDEAKEMRKENMAKGIDSTPFSAKKIVGIDFDKMGAVLTGTNKDNLVMQLNPSKESGGQQPYQQNRIYDSNGISPALCANKADLLIKENKGYIQYADGYEQDNRCYFEDAKSGTLDIKPARQKVLLTDYRIRRLTPTECARLQTIPTWYKWQCSDTQQYRMLGNGWTNDVIEWILSFAKF